MKKKNQNNGEKGGESIIRYPLHWLAVSTNHKQKKNKAKEEKEKNKRI